MLKSPAHTGGLGQEEGQKDHRRGLAPENL